MSKKYFWLKLKDDFFTSREIKKLRKIAGGDTYTIIYLKMQLLSIKKEGLLVYEGTEKDIVEQLSLELDEETDNVSVTLAFLQANNLIEQLSENEFLLNKVPGCIGNETDAAERMRKMRAKRNKVTPMCNIATPALQPVTKSYTEKELKTESKSDLELEKRLGHEKPVTDAGEQQFEKFWEAYPKKIAKKAVLQKWKNLKVSHDLFESIMKGLEAWKQSQQWTKDGGQYIPNPTTFLNQERWNDEVTSFGDPRNRIPTDEEYRQVTAEEFYGI